MQKCIHNGSKNPSKIWKIPEKTVSENWSRNFMPKKRIFFSSGGFSQILDWSQLPTAMYPLRALENCVPCKGKGAYGNLQWLCRFGCQRKVQFLEKYEKTKRFIIFSSKVLGKTPKMTPGDPKNEKNDPQGGQNGAWEFQKWAIRSQKVAQREPKGTKREPKGAK